MGRLTVSVSLLVAMLAVSPLIATASMMGDKSELLSTLDCDFVGGGFYRDAVKVKDSMAPNGAPSLTLSRLKAYGEIGFSIQGQFLGAFRAGVAKSSRLEGGGADGTSYGSGAPFVGVALAVPVYAFTGDRGGINVMGDVEYTTTVEREDNSGKNIAPDNSFSTSKTVSSIRNLWQARIGMIGHGKLWRSPDNKMLLLGYGGVFYRDDRANRHVDTTVDSYTAGSVLAASTRTSRSSRLEASSPYGFVAGVKLNAASFLDIGSPDRWSVALETQYQGAWGGGLSVSRSF